jgi:hypothetical protein
MKARDRRWTWYSQILDSALALAGLATIALMLIRWSFPFGALLLVAFCTGGITAGQLIDVLVGRWARKSNGQS